LLHSGLYGQSFLRVEGQKIVDSTGSNVLLRGMGLGGWLLQEGYMFQVPGPGQQYKIKASIAKDLGEEKTEEFYRKWIQLHTRKADIDSLANWGFNSVRVPLHFRLFTLSIQEEPVKGKNTWLPEGFTLLDELVEWCRQNNIYLILDLHAAPGGQGHDLNISDRNPNLPSLWESVENQEKTIALWEEFAKRYKDEPVIGGYDILNETNWGFTDEKDLIGNREKENKPLRDLFYNITQAIRKHDNKHIIILEGNAFGNNYQGIDPTWDNNMVLSFHKYGNFADISSIQTFLDLRERYNIPIWLGESGENSNNWYRNVIKLMEENNIGWAWWPAKKMGVNNPQEVRVPTHYNRLLESWVTGQDHGLSTEEVTRIWDTVLENLKIENNIIHYDVLDAMFRQISSDDAIPFKDHLLSDDMWVNAVDYDLGRNEVAYSDRDTASYHYVPGVITQGNRGRVYRNDGVDILKDSTGYYISHTEDGEWLQFTIRNPHAGEYEIRVEGRNLSDQVGELAITTESQNLTSIIKSNPNWLEIPVGVLKLPVGRVPIKVKFLKAGFEIKTLRFIKK